MTIRQWAQDAADWVTNNPTLNEGEIGIEADTRKFKFGDGATAWNSLPYVPVVDRIFIGAANMGAAEGAPTLTAGAIADSYASYWSLDAASGETVIGPVMVMPTAWTSLDLFLWTVTPTAQTSAPAVVSVLIDQFEDLDDAATPSSSVGHNNASLTMSATQWVVQRHALTPTGTLVVANSLHLARVRRSGGDGGDTYAGDIGILGVEMVRTS